MTKKDFYFEKALTELKEGYLMPYSLGNCKRTSEKLRLYDNVILNKEAKQVLEDKDLLCNIKNFINICYQAEKKDLRVSGRFANTEHMIYCKVKDYAQWFLNIKGNKDYIYFQNIQKWNYGFMPNFNACI